MADNNIKLKDESLIQNLVRDPPKRKRGRPRKNQQITKHKKRGRKPKNVVQSKPKISKQKEIEEDIILKLPITLSTIQKYSKDTEMDTEIDTEIDTEKGASGSNMLYNVFAQADSLSDGSSDDSDENPELIARIKKQDKLIDKLREELCEYKALLSESDLVGVNNSDVVKMNVKLVDMSSGKTVITKKTDISCWWCSHKFDNMPIFIPERMDKGIYGVFGCYCSIQCAYAYILKNEDYNTGNRISLLKKLYNIGETHIIPAPPMIVLKRFGGALSIEEYRKNNHQKNYRLVMPPMASIVPLVENSYVDSAKYNKIRLFSSSDNLVLKRSKPLPNEKNTLERTMGLRRKRQR